jgi:hypothetical protein
MKWDSNFDKDIEDLIAQAREWSKDAFTRNKQTQWERYERLIAMLDKVNRERLSLKTMIRGYYVAKP